MVRSCVSWLRHLIYALLVLALFGCLLEIGLRVYDSATGQVTRRELYDRGLTAKSWFAHHTLKPSRVFSQKNPDTGDRVRVVTNSLGLRGREPTIPKPPGVVRILCLGDETTLAPHTPESDTFCGRLEQELIASGAQVEVLNAGVPDYCPLLSYLQLKHHLQGLEPDLVILNFDMSDVADDYAFRRHAVTDAAGLPLSCSDPALEMPRTVKGKVRQDELLLLPVFCRQRIGCYLSECCGFEKPRSIDAQICRYLWLEDQPPDWHSHIQHAFAPLAQLRDLLAAQRVGLLVTVCPAPWQISAEASNGDGVREKAGVPRDALYRSRKPLELLTEYCRDQKIELCDTFSAFQQAPQGANLFMHGASAYSNEGHALHARELARSVLAQLRGGSVPAGPHLPQARLPDR